MIESCAVRAHRLLMILLGAASCMGTTEPAPAPNRPARAYRSAPKKPLDEGATHVPRRPPGSYDLGQLPVLTKVLFYVRENYYDKSRINYRQMALGALDFVQRDVPEVVVDRDEARGEVIVRAAGQRRVFSIQRIDAAWSMRTQLQEIFRFIQANLPPRAPEAEGARLLQIETTAVNGMLYSLDPRSVLLDAPTYAEMHVRPADDRGGAVGVTVRLESDGRVAVSEVQADSPAEAAGVAAGDLIIGIDGDAAENMTLDGVIDRLRGAVGSKVELTLQNAGHRGH